MMYFFEERSDLKYAKIFRTMLDYLYNNCTDDTLVDHFSAADCIL